MRALKAIDVAQDFYMQILTELRIAFKKYDAFCMFISSGKGESIKIKFNWLCTVNEFNQGKMDISIGDNHRPKLIRIKSKEEAMDCCEEIMSNWNYGWGKVSSDYDVYFHETEKGELGIHLYPSWLIKDKVKAS